MPEKIYLPLEDAAKLEGITYDAYKKRIQRNTEQFDIRTEQSNNGGKSRILIALSSLSDKARKVYGQKNNEDIRRVLSEMESSDGDEETAWYVGVDIGWYMKKYRGKFLEAVELSNQIERFLEYDGKDKTQYTIEYAEKLGYSARQFRRKIDSYLQGKSVAIEMNEYDGQNYDYYKVLALCPAPRERKAIVFTDEMKVLIQNLWADKKFQVNQQFQKALYDAFKKLCIERNWKCPSYPTVNRYINFLRGKYADVQYYLQNGTREFKRKKMLKRLRNTAKLQVMELVQGDGHTFDCWVKVVRENGKVTAIKPVLVGLIDVKSRCLVGWAICEVANAQIIKQVVYHMMYPKKNTPIYGVPKYLLIDNGKDWTAQTLTGRPRTERFSPDSVVKGFYKSVGIQDDMRSLPYQAWTKAQIERLFGTICSNFTNTLDSYVGTLTGSKTSGKIKKDIQKMLERDELLTIEEFTAAFEKFINEEYHMRAHSGLKRQKEESPIPIDVFQNAERYFMAAPSVEYARIQLLECQERLVTAVGIHILGKVFQHELLAPYIEQRVDVRFDPTELGTIYVYQKDGTKICEIKYEDGLDALASKMDERLMRHIHEQKRQLRNVRKKADELATPFEERKKVLLPELSGEQPQVVGLPDDKQYRNEVKSRKKASKKDEHNEFFDRQYEKAMAKLANL